MHWSIVTATDFAKSLPMSRMLRKPQEQSFAPCEFLYRSSTLHLLTHRNAAISATVTNQYLCRVACKTLNMNLQIPSFCDPQCIQYSGSQNLMHMRVTQKASLKKMLFTSRRDHVLKSSPRSLLVYTPGDLEEGGSRSSLQCCLGTFMWVTTKQFRLGNICVMKIHHSILETGKSKIKEPECPRLVRALFLIEGSFLLCLHTGERAREPP